MILTITFRKRTGSLANEMDVMAVGHCRRPQRRASFRSFGRIILLGGFPCHCMLRQGTRLSGGAARTSTSRNKPSLRLAWRRRSPSQSTWDTDHGYDPNLVDVVPAFSARCLCKSSSRT